MKIVKVFFEHLLNELLKLYYIIQGCHSVRKSQEIRKSQEKFKKMTKVRKSQEKMGGFEKKSGNLIKLKKKVRFCQFKFTKFLVFQSLQMVKIN